MGLQNSNLPGCMSESLNTSLETVGDKMRAEGYKTHLINKSAYDWWIVVFWICWGKVVVSLSSIHTILMHQKMSHTDKNIMENGYETPFITSVGLGFHFAM